MRKDMGEAQHTRFFVYYFFFSGGDLSQTRPLYLGSCVIQSTLQQYGLSPTVSRTQKKEWISAIELNSTCTSIPD
jgi:hypothetical protein